MKRELLQQHFRKSGFDDMQSDALGGVFDEMATSSDMALLRSELVGDIRALRAELKGDMSALRTELRGDMAALRAELKGDMAALRAELTGEMKDLRTEMSDLKADLTWRFVALTAFFATVTALVNIFVG